MPLAAGIIETQKFAHSANDNALLPSRCSAFSSTQHACEACNKRPGTPVSSLTHMRKAASAEVVDSMRLHSPFARTGLHARGLGPTIQQPSRLGLTGRGSWLECGRKSSMQQQQQLLLKTRLELILS
eukprot:4191736-Amphidinium_carterae.1